MGPRLLYGGHDAFPQASVRSNAVKLVAFIKMCGTAELPAAP